MAAVQHPGHSEELPTNVNNLTILVVLSVGLCLLTGHPVKVYIYGVSCDIIVTILY